jgi:hypothetical protein
MGAWDHGLLDNDCAADGLADLATSVAADIEVLGARRPSATTTARLGAAVGVLLQLSPHEFRDEQGEALVAALTPHLGALARSPPGFRRLLLRVVDGGGEALAERPGRLPRGVAGLLHVGARGCPFGRREPALFVGDAAAAYVQSVARRCVRRVDDDLDDDSVRSDLCREGTGMGALAALLVLEPCRVSARRLASWRRKARRGLAELEDPDDDELPFQRAYYANLDRVFAALLARFGDQAA